MTTIIMRGARVGDISFTLDKAIWGEEVCWNVTRISADAFAGRFGPPATILISELPPMTPAHEANVDWGKVNQMLFDHTMATTTHPSPLARPSLMVLHRHRGILQRSPIDGNHRISARRRLQMADFQAFVVPEHLEREYRITTETIDG